MRKSEGIKNMVELEILEVYFKTFVLELARVVRIHDTEVESLLLEVLAPNYD